MDGSRLYATACVMCGAPATEPYCHWSTPVGTTRTPTGLCRTCGQVAEDRLAIRVIAARLRRRGEHTAAVRLIHTFDHLIRRDDLAVAHAFVLRAEIAFDITDEVDALTHVVREQLI